MLFLQFCLRCLLRHPYLHEPFTLILGKLSTILFYFLKIDWYVCIANLSTAVFQHVDAASCGLRCDCPTVNCGTMPECFTTVSPISMDDRLRLVGTMISDTVRLSSAN